MVARNWQKNDNDLAEHLCYNPNMRNWDFGRSPSFLVYTTTDDGIYDLLAYYLAYYLALHTQIQLVLNWNIPIFK